MANERVVLCEACGSEGCLNERWEGCGCHHYTYPPQDCDNRCPWCEGTGGALIETEPVDMEDLDIMCGTAA